MRLAFFLLLFANLGFFAWSSGYLGGRQDGREPERLGQQITPEKIRLVRAEPGAKSAAAPSPGPATASPSPRPADNPTLQACRLIELSADAAAAFERALENEPEVRVTRIAVDAVTLHWVLIPALADRPAAERKLTELRRLGIDDARIANDEFTGPLIVSLGIFSTEKAAQEYLLALNRKGVRSARVEARSRPATTLAFELRAASTVLEGLGERIAGYATAKPRDCPS